MVIILRDISAKYIKIMPIIKEEGIAKDTIVVGIMRCKNSRRTTKAMIPP